MRYHLGFPLVQMRGMCCWVSYKVLGKGYEGVAGCWLLPSILLVDGVS